MLSWMSCQTQPPNPHPPKGQMGQRGNNSYSCVHIKALCQWRWLPCHSWPVKLKTRDAPKSSGNHTTAATHSVMRVRRPCWLYPLLMNTSTLLSWHSGRDKPQRPPLLGSGNGYFVGFCVWVLNSPLAFVGFCTDPVLWAQVFVVGIPCFFFS